MAAYEPPSQLHCHHIGSSHEQCANGAGYPVPAASSAYTFQPDMACRFLRMTGGALGYDPAPVVPETTMRICGAAVPQRASRIRLKSLTTVSSTTTDGDRKCGFLHHRAALNCNSRKSRPALAITKASVMQTLPIYGGSRASSVSSPRLIRHCCGMNCGNGAHGMTKNCQTMTPT